jgi:FAD/FMN-containing dehydrogenase
MSVEQRERVEPATAEEVVEVVASARRDRRPIEIRGGGSVLDRLAAEPTPVLSTAALTGIVEHAVEDLTVTVRAGTSIEELAARLAKAGQESPIEPTDGLGTTVGGRLGTALAGPRQLAAGRVRDWVLRARFVTGAGQFATAGGATVKDVTGYDLCRLLTGSWGTLAVLTEVTLKVRPIAAHRAWYVSDRPRHDLDRHLYRPTAVFTTADRTHVLLEGHPDDAADQAAQVGLAPGEPPVLPTRARASVDPARLEALVVAVAGAGCRWVAQDGVGVCHLDADAAGINAVRQAAVDLGGTLLVLDPQLGLPAFGPRAPRGAMERRVAAALDPDGILAPWRWTR